MQKKSFIAKSVNVVINKIDASCHVKQFIAITVYATENAICVAHKITKILKQLGNKLHLFLAIDYQYGLYVFDILMFTYFILHVYDIIELI